MGQGKSKIGGGNGQITSSEPKALAELLKDDKYVDEFVGKDFQDFYHSFYKVIEELNMKGGAMEFALPSKEKLQGAFTKHCPSGKLGKKDFKKIITELIKLESFSIGKGALDVIMFLFGIPIITVLAKRIIPGADSISDEVVVPIATSGTVLVLVKTHKL